MSVGAPDFYTQSLASIVGWEVEKIAVDIVAQTVSKLAVDIASQSLQELAVKITSQAVTLDVNLVASQVTLDVNVINSVLDVNVTNSVINVQGDVNVTNDVLNVNIQSQTADISVVVSNTASVSIDAQTVDLNVKQELRLGKYLRWQNFDSSEGDSDLDIYSSKWGFYLPRGARGYIRAIRFMIKNTSGSDATVMVAVSIDPTYPPLKSVSVTVPSSQTDYATTNFNIFLWWPFESIYITIKSNIDGVYALGKYNMWGQGGMKDDTDSLYCPWVEIAWLYYPTGDIPVSGIVNTVRIPLATSKAGGVSTVVYPDQEQDLAIITVPGIARFIRLYQDSGTPNDIRFRIVVDDNDIMSFTVGELMKYQETTNTAGGIVVARYDTTNQKYAIFINAEVEFRKNLKIYAYNYSDTTITCSAFVLYSRLV